MEKSNLKTADTTMKIGKFLLELINNPMDYNEMFNFFAKKLNKPVYSKEVLSKYLNTLRALGLEIKKYNSKYYLVNFLCQVNLNADEIKAFNDLETSVLKYGTDKNIKTFYEFKRKILKFFDSESQLKINNYVEQVLTTELGLKIKQFGKICNDEQLIKISYEDEILTIEPKQILFYDNGIYLEGYEVKTYKARKLLLEKVNLIEQQPIKNKNFKMSNTVVYEISGKLASTYKLKEGETLLAENNQKLFIKNVNEDFEFLAKRLIRYKECCKIVLPKEFEEYFKNYIDKIICLYEKNET